MIPDPNQLHPLPGYPRLVFLKPLINHPRIEVGEYTYYDDLDHSTEFVARNVLYKYGQARLTIGRYCAIATGVRFVMAGGNHPMVGVGTYPFSVFGGVWAEQTGGFIDELPTRGDIVVGHNVWFGLQAIILPGVSIGDGAIIGAGAVVSTDVPPYGVVAGNPARLIRQRFTDAEIETLQRVAWWNWPVEKVTRHATTILGGDVAALAALADED